MTGEDLYNQYRSVLQESMSDADPWHTLDENDQHHWGELAKRVRLPLDERETAAALAGLRLLQREIESPDYGSWFGSDIQTIYTNDGQLEGLDPDEIDELCERLNFGD
jgi:hypothetical protein